MSTRAVVRLLWVICAVPFGLSNLNGQAVRFDSVSSTTSAQCASGKICPLNAIPGTQVNICGGTVSTLASCLATPATTYTSATAGTPCATTSQLTPQTGGACLSTSDNQGNFGFWISPGSYSYFLRVPTSAGGGTYGPYPITLGATAGTPAGATVDANYATLALGCSAAGTGTLYVTRAWNGLTTATYACNMYFLGDGRLKPASAQVVTLTGSITAPPAQIFDASVGGAGSILLTSTHIPDIYPNWFGAVMNGSTDDLSAWNAALGACPSSGCAIRMPQNVASFVSGPVVLPAKPVDIGGGGRTGIISGTGGAILQLTYPGQVIHDIGIAESSGAGSTSTIGIKCSYSGTGTIPNQLTIRSVTLLGSAGNPKGKGMSLGGCLTAVIDTTTAAFWNYGLELLTAGGIPSNAVRVTNSNLVANLARQVSDTGGGDVTFSGNDIENGPVGIYQAAGEVAMENNHFEAGGSGGIDYECNVGKVLHSGGNWIGGGKVQLDAGCTGFNSFGDFISDDLANANTSLDAVLYWPSNRGGAITGAGNWIISDVLGWHCVTGAGACTPSNSYTFDAAYTSYIVTSPLTVTNIAAITASSGSPIFTVNQTGNGYGATMQNASSANPTLGLTATGVGPVAFFTNSNASAPGAYSEYIPKSGVISYIGAANGTFNGVTGSPLFIQSANHVVIASPLNTVIVDVSSTGAAVTGKVSATGGFHSSADGITGTTCSSFNGGLCVAP